MHFIMNFWSFYEFLEFKFEKGIQKLGKQVAVLGRYSAHGSTL
jgi:hypothetical protein